MAGKHKISKDLDYLQKPPIRLNYRVVAGKDIDPIQLYDLVFDETDLRVRKLDTEENLLYLREVQK